MIIQANFDEAKQSQLPAVELLINMGYKYLSPTEVDKQRKNDHSKFILQDIAFKKLMEINWYHHKGIDYRFSEKNVHAAIQELENIPLEGLIDFKEEKIRLDKELQKVRKDLIFVSKKLSNRDFMAKAPAEVVEKDKDKQKMLIVKENKLQENLKSITRMCE